MKFLEVVTPPSIYHGCSTRKMFWEEKFTCKKNFFQSVNMRNCGPRKVRKHNEIKGSDKIFTLNASSKFDSLNKMKTISFRVKRKIGEIRKWVGNRSGSQDQSKVQKNTKRQSMPSEMSE